MPPKKKKQKAPKLINGLGQVDMTNEQIVELGVSLEEQLQREKEERDVHLRETDDILGPARKITDRRLEEARAKLQNREKELEDDERRHQVEVKVYKQNMKHVLHEHQNTMAALREKGSVSTEVLQEEQEQSQAELQEETDDFDMLVYEEMKKFETKLEEEMTESRNSLVKNISEMKSTYEQKFKSQERVLEDIMRKVAKETEDHRWRHIDNLKKDHDAAHAEAIKIIDHLKRSKTVKKLCELLEKQIKKNDQRLVALDQSNRDLAERILMVEDQVAGKDSKIQYCERKRDTCEKHHMKELNALKLQHEDLEQKLSKLQLDIDEHCRKSCEASERMQHEANVQISVRMKKLKALTERLEETRAQLRLLLSASNIDQTALAGITKTIQENLNSCNKSIKNLQDEKAMISKAHKDLLLSFETKQSVSRERLRASQGLVTVTS